MAMAQHLHQGVFTMTAALCRLLGEGANQRAGCVLRLVGLPHRGEARWGVMAVMDQWSVASLILGLQWGNPL